MTSQFKKSILISIASFLPLFANATGKLHFIESRSGDYCRDELEDLLRRNYGPDVKITSASTTGQGDGWWMWAKTNLCDGLVAANFAGEKWNCKQGRYGSNPHSLISAYGTEGCKRVIPGTIYW